MPTGLECVCCKKIPEVKAIHLKGKARLSWNTAALEFTEVVVCRYFSKYVFLKISLYSLENTCVGVAYLKIFFQGLLFQNFIKKRPWRRCFPVNITKLVTASEFLTKLAENNCEENHLLQSFSQKCPSNYLLVLAAKF